MDLRRLKTIFIIVLVCVNVALLSAIHSTGSHESRVNAEMLADAQRLLQKHMIFIAPKLEIPSAPEVKSFYLEKMSVGNREMVTRFLGESYTETAEGEYKNGGRTLTVSGEDFRYTDSSPKAPSDFTSGEIEELCRGEMERLGVLSKLYSFSGVNYVADDRTRAIFTAQHDDAVFFDAYISFDVTKDGIVSASGKNLISDLTVSGSSVPYFNIMSILPDLAENPVLDANKKYTVVSIKPGYYIGRGAESYRNILAIPVWQIVTDMGDILYYDARNGSYIKED